jgi:hypothetical protein
MAGPTTNKRVIPPFVVFHLLVAALTWRDIRRRPPEQIRGSKTVWRIASGANTLGSVAYWLFGRK